MAIWVWPLYLLVIQFTSKQIRIASWVRSFLANVLNFLLPPSIIFPPSYSSYPFFQYTWHNLKRISFPLPFLSLSSKTCMLIEFFSLKNLQKFHQNATINQLTRPGLYLFVQKWEKFVKRELMICILSICVTYYFTYVIHFL